MQSKYKQLLSLANDIEDLEFLWFNFLIDDELKPDEKNNIVHLFIRRYEKLKGR